MADTTYFDPTTNGRPSRDLLKQEVRNRLQALELQLNTDRTNLGTAESNVTALQTEQAKLVGGDIEYKAGQDLTDATAFDLCTIPVPDENGVVVEVEATVFADDGTDHQIVSLKATIAAVNQGGTITAVVGEHEDDEILAASGGTFTLAFAAAEGADNVLDISITANSSLTPTTFKVWWRARVRASTNGDGLTQVNMDA